MTSGNGRISDRAPDRVEGVDRQKGPGGLPVSFVEVADDLTEVLAAASARDEDPREPLIYE